MRHLAAVTIIALLTTTVLSVAVLGGVDFIGLTDKNPQFAANVDFEEGSNYYSLVEIDEGDNNEEKEITLILHEFVFTSTDNDGLVTWDFGDGNMASGAIVSHQYESPGVYIVMASLLSSDVIEVSEIVVTVHLEATAEVDNMECECAPTAKDTVIDLLALTGTMTFQGYVQVEHDGSSESCSLRNPLQECHLRVILQRTDSGSVVGEDVMFDGTFRSNELVVDFEFTELQFEEGQGLQLRLETDQLRDWHKPMASWSSTAPLSG